MGEHDHIEREPSPAWVIELKCEPRDEVTRKESVIRSIDRRL